LKETFVIRGNQVVENFPARTPGVTAEFRIVELMEASVAFRAIFEVVERPARNT
jgi:hypothetical protein